MVTLKKVQQTPDMCGPASLVSLLDFYGIRKTEQELAVLCKSNSKDGTPRVNIMAALETLGVRVITEENSSWETLQALTERDIPVFVAWWSDYTLPGDDHYSLAYKVTDDFIYLMDPEIGDYREVPKDKFLSNWFDSGGNPVKRWYLYIEKL